MRGDTHRGYSFFMDTDQGSGHASGPFTFMDTDQGSEKSMAEAISQVIQNVLKSTFPFPLTSVNILTASAER